MSLRPLIPKVPLVGAVTVAFLNNPVSSPVSWAIVLSLFFACVLTVVLWSKRSSDGTLMAFISRVRLASAQKDPGLTLDGRECVANSGVT